MAPLGGGESIAGAILALYGGALGRLALLLVGLVCLSLWGRPIVRRLVRPEAALPGAWLWQLVAGFSLYGFALSLIGLLGLYATWSSVALLLLGPVWWARQWRHLWVALRTAVGRSLAAAWPPMPAVALGACFVVLLPAVLAPEIFYDALYYHLGLPAQYLEYGRVVTWPDVVHSAFPATLDLIFGVALGCGGAELAKLLGLALFALAVLACARVGRALSSGPGTAWLAAALLATTPGVALMATMTQVDVGMMFAGAMTCFGLTLAWRADGVDRGRMLLLVGFPVGLMLGSKYTGVYALMAVIAAWAVAGPASARARLTGLGAVVVVALSLAAPWYVRNVIVFHNPVYPALGGLFGETPAALWAVERLGRDLPQPAWSEVGAIARGLFLGSPSLGAGGELGLLLPFGLLALAWLVLKRREARLPALFAVVFAALWMTHAPAARYLYPLLPLVAAAGGAILAELGAHSRLARVGVSLVVLLGAGDGLATVVGFERGLYSPHGELGELLGGGRSRAAYLEALLPHAGTLHWANDSLPREAVVLFVGETRPAYFERRAVFASAYDRPRLWAWIEESGDGRGLHERLVSLGITHLLVNRNELARLRRAYDHLAVPESEMSRVQGLLRGCRLLHNDGRSQIWAL